MSAIFYDRFVRLERAQNQGVQGGLVRELTDTIIGLTQLKNWVVKIGNELRELPEK